MVEGYPYACFTIQNANYMVKFFAVWRNWYTQRTQNPPTSVIRVRVSSRQPYFNIHFIKFLLDNDIRCVLKY
nr:MAG TPA: hypothetical protein [Caudoviricetes sp.]